ncbi:transcriptional regulator [Methylococcaceae bacterium HT1]|uniref:helix-turn-helix domain-containing protein n=1 Tax=Bathymodiolus platifrons methanotrophic gill symbiont TaxID=113268 RepID=UPI000B40C6AF|nr:helix-turn-helix transcriptional regulator [Bathymodiolus platifrons methanotrophic gill symbiont]TXK94250.1 transcriptional regulator [Methylococcaceae bacterium HT1]TXK97188.1 transcriptional regulator [Methylococcaceae bacterium CS4]TXL05858.1 transcriptional regulator [Methylococcaceae bacterium CS2]TXL07701.1 transcriptional regulator [Methylococcaceae bacterium CS1]TXL12795.1 transcriptional regulator [Methylococcaceae bacterium HT4]TXL18390.1 transcriptional regulator [Methylococcac
MVKNVRQKHNWHIKLIKERGMKQQQASKLLGNTQPEVSQIANGHLSGFTFDKLYRCLYALDMDIEITIKKHISTGNMAGIHVFNPNL